MNEAWSKFFIVDKTTIAVQGLRFGYGFKGEFDDKNEPLFARNAESVKLYDKLEDAKTDYDKLTQVAIVHIIIRIGNGPAQVMHTIIESK